MATIPDGYGFVAGRKRVTAARLLAIAAELDLPAREISATSDGYIVPIAVLDVYEGAAEAAPDEGDSGEVPASEPTPTSDWKNPEIEKWASDHGVDLGGATKKADMLAAIAAVNKEE